MNLRVARWLIETWSSLYTFGLPARHRDDRRDALRADVLDQIRDETQAGVSGWRIAAGLLSRCLRGLPDDLLWRLFEARRLPHEASDFGSARSVVMDRSATWTGFFAIGSGLAWAVVLVFAFRPVEYSLAYAGGLVALIALTGWALEARAAGDDQAAGPSAWPGVLALGVVGAAAGFVFREPHIGLVAVTPLAAGLGVAFVRNPRFAPRTLSAQPLPAGELASRAARGDVIAIERAPGRGITRRALLRGGFTLGLASLLAAMGGLVVDFLYQRNVSGFGGVVTAGPAAGYPPGSKTIVRAGKFWLVNLTAEQGGPGFLALWQKCPHLGCVVPWNPTFRHVDPATGKEKEGWFRCPCHQSTYSDAGVRVYGPATRSMDRMALRINEDGIIEVDTGDISKGNDDNATFAVRPPEA